VPDLFLRGSIGYSTEFLETPGIANNRRTGPEAGAQIGVTLPVFNRQQGRIAAAQAELLIAEREVERLRLILRTRLASSLREYRNAKVSAARYRTRIVPRAREAYRMYLTSFRQMAAAYPQVLIAQRTLFQVEVEYARALTELRRSTAGLRGFLLSGGLEAPTGGETRSFEVDFGMADDDANQ
jgi:cobalt-zinc-cadmium efflux system outer membrane protein